MSQERMRKILTVAGIAATLALAGCADGLDDLRADIEKAKQRPREYLEQFPLDTLKMVGTLRLGAGNYGLVQTKDGLIHRVLPGNHLGQNDGRVMAVSDAKITLVEIIPDGLGGYLERPAALALAD